MHSVRQHMPCHRRAAVSLLLVWAALLCCPAGVRPANPATSCTVTIKGSGSAIASAALTCSGPGVPVAVSGTAALQPFAAKFAGARFVADANSAGLLSLPAGVTVQGSAFSSIDAGAGAVLTFSGSGAAALVDTTFTGCTAGTSPVQAQGVDLTVDGCTFTGNRGGFAGGALSVTDGSLAITNSKFVNNKALVNGGAISHNSTAGSPSFAATIAGSTFTGNSASCNGGATYSNQIAKHSIEGSTFSDNVLTQFIDGNGGGGICFDLSVLVVAGAGAYVREFDTSTITGTKFLAHQSKGEAALYQVAGGSATISHCTFIDNEPTFGKTGALTMARLTTASIQSSSFQRNTGLQWGAVLVDTCAKVTLGTTTFTSNVGSAVISGGGGGGVTLLSGCSNGCTVSASAFANNTLGADSAGAGGAIYATQQLGNVNILGNTFSLNAAPGVGGAVALEGSAPDSIVSLTNNTFTANQVTDSTGSGGALGILSCPTVLVQNNSFHNNAAASVGAGLWNSGNSGSQMLIEDCRFINNSAGNAGGGLQLTTVDFAIIRNSVFGQNSALNGAGAYLGSLINATVANTAFGFNTANYQGGGVYLLNYQAFLGQNLTFQNNSVQAGEGGAIYMSGNLCLTDDCILGSTEILESTFVGNDAFTDNFESVTYGGAIFFTYGDNLTLTRSTFLENVCNVSGGAVAVYGANYFTSQQTTFHGNSAGAEGGAIYGLNLDLAALIQDTEFVGNTAAGNGGAISFDGTNVTVISNSTFTNNKASAGGNGGAVNLNNGLTTANIRSSSFRGNSAAGQGGGLGITGGCGIIVTATQLQNNKALGGGGVFLSALKDKACPGQAPPLFSKVKVISNAAEEGGGMLVQGVAGSVRLTAVNFTANSATVSAAPAAATASQLQAYRGNSNGGAVAIVASPDGSLDISTSAFTLNSAVGAGGALYGGDNASVVVNLTTFSGNTAGSDGGALACVSCDDLSSRGCVFSGNSAAAGLGGGFSCTSCVTAEVADAVITNNSASQGGGAALAAKSSGRSRLLNASFSLNNATGNDALSGGGGGLLVTDGQLWVGGAEFRSNLAQGSGGGLIVQPTCTGLDTGCSFAQLDGVTFSSNTALAAGGALFSGAHDVPVLLNCGADAAGCQSAFIANTAAGYGANVASGPASLVVSPGGVQEIKSQDKLNVSVTLIDNLGQVVAGQGGLGENLLIEAKASASNTSLALFGQVKSVTTNGTAQFTALGVQGQAEGLLYELDFSLVSSLYPDVAGTSLQVYIRACVTGEIITGDLCVECLINSYSFNITQGCETCPNNNANCLGGATIIPQDGSWHSAANSTELFQCPYQAACQYASRQNNLTSCQLNWYAAYTTAAYTPDGNLQLEANLSSLDCQLWGLPNTDPKAYMQQQCSPGYTGNLCGKCDILGDSGYTQGSHFGLYQPFICKKCQSSKVLVVLAIIGLVLQFVLVTWTTFSTMSANRENYLALEVQASDYMRPFVTYLQYNFVANNLSTNFPQWMQNYNNFFQALFANVQGFFSLDCILKRQGGAPLPLQRAFINLGFPLLLLALATLFWLIWWAVVQPWLRKRRKTEGLEHILHKVQRRSVLAPAESIPEAIPEGDNEEEEEEDEDDDDDKIGAKLTDGEREVEMAQFVTELPKHDADKRGRKQKLKEQQRKSSLKGGDAIAAAAAMLRRSGKAPATEAVPGESPPTLVPSPSRSLTKQDQAELRQYFRRMNSIAPATAEPPRAAPSASSSSSGHGVGSPGFLKRVLQLSDSQHKAPDPVKHYPSAFGAGGQLSRLSTLSSHGALGDGSLHRSRLANGDQGDVAVGVPTSSGSGDLPLHEAIQAAIEEGKRRFQDQSQPELVRLQSLQAAMNIQMAVEVELETFPDYIRRICILSILVIAFVVYPNICLTVLSFFSCYPLDQGFRSSATAYPQNSMATWVHGYWEQDMDQECYTGYHMVAVWAIGVPGLILICCGIPLAGALVLWRYRGRLLEPQIAATYGFLYHQYREQYWYWNAVEQLRMLLLVAITVFGRNWTPFVQNQVFVFVLVLYANAVMFLRPVKHGFKMEYISTMIFALITYLTQYFIEQQYSNLPPNSNLVVFISYLITVLDFGTIAGMLVVILCANRDQIKKYFAAANKRRVVVGQYTRQYTRGLSRRMSTISRSASMSLSRRPRSRFGDEAAQASAASIRHSVTNGAEDGALNGINGITAEPQTPPSAPTGRSSKRLWALLGSGGKDGGAPRMDGAGPPV